jgi:hypothetical protein
MSEALGTIPAPKNKTQKKKKEKKIPKDYLWHKKFYKI